MRRRGDEHAAGRGARPRRRRHHDLGRPTRACPARCAASPARARLRFAHADFLDTGFEDASFDGVVGIESVCYAEPKSAFLAEAWRVLRPGGRLVVLDGFRQRTALTPRDARDLSRFVSGWALSGLAFVGEFDAALHAAGFESVDYSDKRRAVMPSAWIMEGIAWIGFWSIGLACWLEVLPRLWLDHGLACLSQRRLFQRETLTYGVFTARKPRATNPGS
jgi:tocopherol O-methyltransferase